MNADATPSKRGDTQALPLGAVALIAGAALAYEILLTRWFALVHWHSLVATAISLALLGYGASGSFLAFFNSTLRQRFAPAFIANAILFSVSVPLCTGLAQLVPLDPEALLWDPLHLLLLAATFLILTLPFFAAANCIGLTLNQFQAQIPRIYGSDLLGAAAGAAAVTLVLNWLPLHRAILGVSLAGLLVGILAAMSLRWHLFAVSLLSGLLAAFLLVGEPLVERPSAYKDLSRSLNVSGASLAREWSGVAGKVSIVLNREVPTRHAPGLSLHSMARLPQQSAVFVDGDAAGAITENTGEAGAQEYLGELISALPYRLLEMPRTLILNAGPGLRAQQAAALGAAAVVAVEPNPLLVKLRCREDPPGSGGPCSQGRVTWYSQSARGFVASNQEQFDLVSVPADSDRAGLDALKVDFSLTAEAIRQYLARLSADGMLVIEGATRLPPRLSMRMLATVRDVLAATGDPAPGDRIVMLRGWQRYLLLVGKQPLSATRLAGVRRFAEDGGFDRVWLPDMHADEANRFQQLRRAQYYLAARQVLAPGTAGNAPAPAYDDRPFPHRFSDWWALWMALADLDSAEARQLDTALLVAAATLLVAVIASVLLILLPLLAHRDAVSTPSQRGRILAYFSLIGIAFLFIEIAWIQRLQLFLDQPLYATAIVLSAFLLFAGLGSLWAQGRGSGDQRRTLVGATAVILVSGLAYLLLLPGLLDTLATLPLALRILVSLVLISPLAFAMGIPFAVGLQRFGDTAPGLIPWAWGINGCLSVISAAGAPLLALGIGFSGLIAVALIAYALVPLCYPRT